MFDNYLYEKGDWHKAPNLISYVRLIGCWVPAVFILSHPHVDSWWIAATIAFIVVVLTDAVDGFVARRFNQITDLGKIIDPLVDKILVFFTLIALSIVDPWLWIVTAIITLREVVVSLQIRTRGKLVAAVWSGKFKMALQGIMVIVLLIPGHARGWYAVQLIAIGAALVLTIYSWWDYHRRFVAAAEPVVR